MYEIKQHKKYKYIEEGEGNEVLILLHGLVGTLSNFDVVIQHFSSKMKVVVPMLPLYSLDLRYTSIKSLHKFVHGFIKKHFDTVHLLGNSLGGHIAIIEALEHPSIVKSLILTGSSGLFESGLGDSYPRRGDYEYVKRQAEMVFYDPKHATKPVVDNAFEIVNNRVKALKTIYLSRSALRHNVSKELKNIVCPTLLIWGENDLVTPKFVGEDFNKLIKGSELKFIPECGHAPMMEHPELFNEYVDSFLEKHFNIK